MCSCLGEYHGGRGERREWKLSGAHTLLSRGPTHKRYLIVHRREPRLETVKPEPESAQQLPEPAVSTPPTDVIRADPSEPAYATSITNRHRDPAPARPRTPADDQPPPGCGTELFLVALAAMFGVLAVTVSPWFWIGVGVLTLGIFLAVVENS
ncbi:hypothetical protein ACFXO9_31560 [Nocardia tengchongensis]|uniref:hypothetical protein n=1 Tax=Nocardia tengchongensis TaxID=2055889 RepID=UPI00369A96BE